MKITLSSSILLASFATFLSAEPLAKPAASEECCSEKESKTMAVSTKVAASDEECCAEKESKAKMTTVAAVKDCASGEGGCEKELKMSTVAAKTASGEECCAEKESKMTNTVVSAEKCDSEGACDDKMRISVKGMTCGACAEKVTNALASVEGVKSPDACHELGLVCFDNTEEVSLATVMSTISELGLKPVGKVVSYQVSNMTCSGCSETLTDKLVSAEGVVSVKGVCHKSGKAEVVIDPSATSTDSIAAVINETNFKVIN